MKINNLFKYFKIIAIVLFVFIIILEITGYLLKSYRAGRFLFRADSGENKYDPWSQWIPSWEFTDKTGFRKTVCNPNEEDSCFTLWMFGGSTLVGFTDEDSLRIPSLVAKRFKLEYPDKKIRLVNWGVSGYNSQQEIRLFLNLLTKYSEPNAVLFYDGGNDIATQLTYENVNAHFLYETFDDLSTCSIQLPFVKSFYYGYTNSYINYIQFIFRKILSYKDTGDKFTKLVKASCESYFRNASFIISLCNCMRIKPFFILQPFLMSESEPKINEEKHIWNSKPESYRKLVREFYNGIATQLWKNGMFYDLSNVFNNRKNIVYRDPIHLYDDARRIVADSIYTSIKDVLVKNISLQDELKTQ